MGLSLGETLDNVRDAHKPCTHPSGCEFCLAMALVQTAYEEMMARLFELTPLGPLEYQSVLPRLVGYRPDEMDKL